MRFLRLIVFFDLPTNSALERKSAARFRNFLIKNGFFMMQYSIYCRLCRGQDGINKYKNRLQLALPGEGNVRAMQVTEKQYVNIDILIGNKSEQESIGEEGLLLF